MTASLPTASGTRHHVLAMAPAHIDIGAARRGWLEWPN
jgi:hypothetical protein